MSAELRARGDALRDRALRLLGMGCPETAAALLTAAARDYAEAGALGAQTAACFELADLHDRRGDQAARQEWLFEAFVAAGAAGDRLASGLALDQLYPSSVLELAAAA